MKNVNEPITAKTLYRSIKVLPLAMIVGLCLMSLLLYFLKSGETEINDTFGTAGLMGVALFAGVAIIAGAILFQKRVAFAFDKPLADKLVLYRQGIILRFALLEFPGITSVLFYFLTNNYLYLMITATIVIVMMLNRPNDDSITQHLNLTNSDKKAIENS